MDSAYLGVNEIEQFRVHQCLHCLIRNLHLGYVSLLTFSASPRLTMPSGFVTGCHRSSRTSKNLGACGKYVPALDEMQSSEDIMPPGLRDDPG